MEGLFIGHRNPQIRGANSIRVPQTAVGNSVPFPQPIHIPGHSILSQNGPFKLTDYTERIPRPTSRSPSKQFRGKTPISRSPTKEVSRSFSRSPTKELRRSFSKSPTKESRGAISAPKSPIKIDNSGDHSNSETLTKISNPKIPNQELIEKTVEEVMATCLRDVRYETSTCIRLSESLAGTIMEKIKPLSAGRFKMVVIASIGNLKEQAGMQFGSRCLWNKEFDSFMSVKYSNDSLFAVAMVYCLLFE